jgi:hypothetical protein
VNDELFDFPATIELSKSSLLLKNTHFESKRSNEEKPESDRAKDRAFPSTYRVEKGGMQGT